MNSREFTRLLTSGDCSSGRRNQPSNSFTESLFLKSKKQINTSLRVAKSTYVNLEFAFTCSSIVSMNGLVPRFTVNLLFDGFRLLLGYSA